MGKRTTTNVIILIVTFLIVLVSIILLIMQAEANVAFWILRPSEMSALDIVGRFTALGGTMGTVKMEYKNPLNITYFVINSDKMNCVISQVKEAEGRPVVGGMMTTINCYSTPFPTFIQGNSEDPYLGYGLSFDKAFQSATQFIQVSAKMIKLW